MIGVKYKVFGVLLLRDTQGAIVDRMERDHPHDTLEVSTQVLQLWIAGRGRRPTTWITLIDCLRDAELNTLADDIEETIISSLLCEWVYLWNHYHKIISGVKCCVYSIYSTFCTQKSYRSLYYWISCKPFNHAVKIIIYMPLHGSVADQVFRTSSCHSRPSVASELRISYSLQLGWALG